MNNIRLLVLVVIISGFYSCTGEVELTMLSSVPIENVRIVDNFWKPKIELNRITTIPYAFGKCEETGRIDNFAKAAGIMEGDYSGERYNDSDVYKIFEGACYSLINKADPQLRKYVDSLALLISGAQEEDGYLYTNRTVSPDKPAPGAGRDKWIDVWVSHELYNVGHMYEAAVAYYRATGERTLLDVAIKNANLVYSEFGWGKREAAPGHQEIEIGLVKLYDVTGDSKYLELAQFFLDVRGLPQDHLGHESGSRFAVYNDKLYLQQHLPVLEQKEAVGHAVRATYMYSAMSDVSDAIGDNKYSDVSRNIWNDVVSGKIYITGGIGSKEDGEAFGEKFELPNMTAYTETCASVANVFWNERLFLETGDSKYIDILERVLYNGLISGVAADGTNFFYPNPLESDGRFLRSGWFDCSCCPGNIARFMPQIPQYIYSTANNNIFINLFIGSEAEVILHEGYVNLSMETDYPWTGNVSITINKTEISDYNLRIRIPGWTGKVPMPGGLYSFSDSVADSVRIEVNEKERKYKVENGYAVLSGKWREGDHIVIDLPLRVREVLAREEVKSASNRIALSAGPLVYCLEEADNGKVRNLLLNSDYSTRMKFREDLLNGIGTIEVKDKNFSGTAIPYYAWNNRGRGEMIVWIKKQE